MDDLQRRAFAAWFRSGGFDQPDGSSGVSYTASNGKTYLPLYNCNGLLAVYRLDNAGRLKGLKRWPKEIGQRFG